MKILIRNKINRPKYPYKYVYYSNNDVHSEYLYIASIEYYEIINEKV